MSTFSVVILCSQRYNSNIYVVNIMYHNPFWNKVLNLHEEHVVKKSLWNTQVHLINNPTTDGCFEMPRLFTVQIELSHELISTFCKKNPKISFIIGSKNVSFSFHLHQ